MSLKVGTLDNKTSEEELTLVQRMRKMISFREGWANFTEYYFNTSITPVLEDYQEALSRRRQHCKTVNELNERLSRENDKLKKILSDNGINQYIS